VKSPSRPLIAFIACGLIWGTTFLAIRVGNDSLPALWACTLRFVLAALILNGIVLVTGRGWPRGEALKPAVLYGFLEFGVSMPLLYWGEKVVPSGLAAVLYAICPVSAMLTARMLGMERLNPRRLGAAVLAFGGVAVIFWRELAEGGSPLGLIAIFFAAVAAPLAGLMLQRGPKQSPIGVNAVGTLIGIPFAFACSLALGEHRVFPTTSAQVLPIVYLAVVGSVGAFVIFAWLINHWRATTVSFLGVIVPVIAVVVGAVARHEALAPGSLAGAAIVLVGVVAALRSESEPVPLSDPQGA